MQYRYSRGQPGQSSLPRPAWGSGSGSHGARTASPEPSGLSGSTASAPLGSGNASQEPKDRMAATPQDEVVLQLEHEVYELRNLLSWKDQRIAELSRTDTPAARLKRDIRHLAAELHHTRKELSESVREAQDLKAQLERGEVSGSGRDGAQRDIVDSPSAVAAGSGATPTSASGHGVNSSGGTGRGSTAGSDRSAQHRGRILELEEENRQLRESVVQLKAQGLADNLHQGHARQPSGASTQRAAEPPTSSVVQPVSAAIATTASGSAGVGATAGYVSAPSANRQSYINQQAATLSAPSPATVVSASAPGTSAAAVVAAPVTAALIQEEPVRQTVYSSANPEHTATIGPTTLQGVGTVDGVAMVAKVLLQRIHSSVCAAHRRPAPTMATTLNAPGAPLMVQQMPLTN